MTVDLSLNTKLLSLSTPHQKGSLAELLPWEASFREDELSIRYLDFVSLKQTNLHYFKLAAPESIFLQHSHAVITKQNKQISRKKKLFLTALYSLKTKNTPESI